MKHPDACSHRLPLKILLPRYCPSQPEGGGGSRQSKKPSMPFFFVRSGHDRRRRYQSTYPPPRKGLLTMGVRAHEWFGPWNLVSAVEAPRCLLSSSPPQDSFGSLRSLPPREGERIEALEEALRAFFSYGQATTVDCVIRVLTRLRKRARSVESAVP